MNTINLHQVSRLIDTQGETCVSIYMPVIWAVGQWRQNPIRLRNLLNQAESQLIARGLARAEVAKILEPAGQMAAEESLWLAGHEGLGLFFTSQDAWCLPLRSPVAERVLVEERFLVTPLLPLVQTREPIHLIAVSENRVRFFSGDTAQLIETPVPNLPTSLAEACGHNPVEPTRVCHGAGPCGKSPGVAVYHGQGSKKDHTRIDLARYMRLIQDALLPVLQEKPYPMIFAGVEDLFASYQEANAYPRLLEDHLSGNMDRMTNEGLVELAAKVFMNRKAEEIATAVEECVSAPPHMAAQSISEILAAALDGAVSLLVYREGACLWGSYDTGKRQVCLAEKFTPGKEDLVNRAVIETLRRRGRAFATFADELGGQGIAARFRYPLRSSTVQLVEA